jgi:hypothetical protein
MKGKKDIIQCVGNNSIENLDISHNPLQVEDKNKKSYFDEVVPNLSTSNLPLN